MITTFLCKTAKCPNKGVEYNMDGEIESAECGGCHKMLKPVPPVIPATPEVSPSV